MRGIDKEMELPKLLETVANMFLGKPNIEPINKKMRSAGEILKDYGLGGE